MVATVACTDTAGHRGSVDDKIDMKSNSVVQYLQDDRHALSASDNILPGWPAVSARQEGGD